MEITSLKLLIHNGSKGICQKDYDFLALVGFTKSFLLQTPWANATEKTEGLFQSHNGVCFSKAETISRMFKAKRQSLCQISLDHKNNRKDRIMLLNMVYMYTCFFPSLFHTHTHTHIHTRNSHTYIALSFVNQINISDTNEGSSGEERIILKCENIPGRKRQICLRVQIHPINHMVSMVGDCSSFWQLCNYSLNTTTTFFGNRHSICKTITALGITAGQSPGYIRHNPLGDISKKLQVY